MVPGKRPSGDRLDHSRGSRDLDVEMLESALPDRRDHAPDEVNC